MTVGGVIGGGVAGVTSWAAEGREEKFPLLIRFSQ
jgi:hypothetical protein